MIPSWTLNVIHLGPIPIQVWGLFVAAGIVVAIVVATRRARRAGLDRGVALDLAGWVLLAAFVGARLGHVLLYEPGYYLAHPVAVLRIWEGGLSSFGGFAGALVAAVVWIYHRKLPFLHVSDVILGALPIGWTIGRLGCYSIHDHPGIPCTGVLCVPFPDGVRRLDMGLLDGLLTLVIACVLLLARPYLAREGRTTAVVVGGYGVGRFFLDFLRVGDATYLGLTPAQYGSLVLVGCAVVVAVRRAWRPVTG